MSNSPATWLDGSPCSELPLPDRGLDYGDGLFETLLLNDGRPLYLKLHMERLRHGLEVLRFPDVMDTVRDYLDAALNDLAPRQWPWTALRLSVTRGAGPRGYAPPDSTAPRVLLGATPLERNCGEILTPAVMGVSSVRWPTQPLLAGLKHLNRLEQVLAAGENRDRDTDDSLMRDQQGNVISALAGNIFLVKGDRLLTPALKRCGIAGTRRALVMDHWAPAQGLAVEEGDFGVSELAVADEVFISNSLVGLRPVASIEGYRWQHHTVCEALFKRYLGEIN